MNQSLTSYRRDPNAPFAIDDVMATLHLVRSLQEQEMQHIAAQKMEAYQALQLRKEDALAILAAARELMRQGQLLGEVSPARREQLKESLEQYEAYFLDVLYKLERRLVLSQLHTHCVARAHEEISIQDGAYQATGVIKTGKVPPLTIHALT
jgi:hypothetical protein